MSEFLPDGYETLKTDKPYTNLSKLPEGEYKFRIVRRPIAGWIDWKESKPHRFRPSDKPKASFDAEKPMRVFWACYVWDYTKDGLYVMEITQSSLLKSLTNLGKDEDWGDFMGYDIKIKKTGSGKETEYALSPVPHKSITDKIKQAIVDHPVRLEALYEGKDPWSDLETTYKGEPAKITEDQIAQMRELIGKDLDIQERVLKWKGYQLLGEFCQDEFDSIMDKIESAKHNKRTNEAMVVT